MTRLTQLLKALAALAVVTGLLLAVPAALLRFVGWPLPTVWPTVDQIRQFAQTGVSDTTVIKTLAVVVWIAWAQIAIAILVETVALARRRAATTLPLLPGLQPVAARLVATIALIAAATASSKAGIAAAMPLNTVVSTAPATEPTAVIDLTDATPATQPEIAPKAATTTVITTTRDSWWRLAERHLGDGIRWRELRDLNLGRTVGPGVTITDTTDQLDEGWRVLVPAGEPDTTTARPTLNRAPAEEQAGLPGEVEVQPGDHFWSIAEDALTEAWDRSPTDAETTGYWHDVVEANRDRLAPPGDPDLIYPGQHFELPPTPTDPELQAGGAAPDEAAPADQADPTPDVDEPTDVPAARAEASAPAGAGSIPGLDVNAPVHDGWQAAIESRAASTDHADAPANSVGLDDLDEDDHNGLRIPVGLPAGLAATTFMAAGIVALLRWRRRAALRRRPETYRLPTPLPSTQARIDRLETAAAPEETLDDLASLLASVPDDTHPALVTATDDGTVNLLFDDASPLPEPPAPWTLADDGSDGPVGWVARLGDRGPERSIGLPLLVTLGRTGDTTILANVAAMPRLQIIGDEGYETRRRLRTAALEVATSRLAVPVDVVVLGDHLFDSLDRIRHERDPAKELQAALAEIRQNIVPEDRTPRLFICYDLPAPEIPDELVGTVGVIALTADTAVPWRLQIDSDTTGQLLLPDGGCVELALPDVDPWDINHELSKLDRGALAPEDPPAAEVDVTMPEEDRVPDAAGAASDDETGQPEQVGVEVVSVTEPAWCEVQLLGNARVIRDGRPVDGITPKTMEVLAYLVTHRDGVSKERVDDAVWAGRDARPGSQRVNSALTKVREALGYGPDGELLVPRRSGSDLIRISQHLGSDLDRAFAHLAIARDLPVELRAAELTAALDLVRGEALENVPVSWATDITQRAIAQLQDAALDLARLRRDAGDYDAAEDAIRRGLRLLDPADALYLELAEIELARGRPDRIEGLWRQLCQRHGADADEVSGLVSSPPPEIELAFRSLVDVRP